MRVTLTDDEARAIGAWLESSPPHGLAVGPRDLVSRFTPTERVTAEVREHVYPYVLTYRGEPLKGDDYETREGAESAAAQRNFGKTNYGVASLDPPVKRTLLTCPRCGSTDFALVENELQYRTASHDDDGQSVLWIGSDDGNGEGDDDPGLVCDDFGANGCGARVELPDGWEIEYV